MLTKIWIEEDNDARRLMDAANDKLAYLEQTGAVVVSVTHRMCPTNNDAAEPEYFMALHAVAIVYRPAVENAAPAGNEEL